MQSLTNEVKAKETHESAMFWHNRAEHNLYKFFLEIKDMRDERLFIDLGYRSFDEYCQSAWNLKRRVVDERIQIATSFNEEDFKRYSAQLGHKKTLFLAQMDESQRGKSLTEGIPTDQGYKSISEASQKEINEYKRNAEQAEQRAKQAETRAQAERNERERLERENTELANREPMTIEKEVIKEIDKTDYERIRSLEEQIKRMQTNDQDVSAKEKEVKLLQLDASKSVLKTKITIDEFLQEVAFTSYRRGAIASSSEGTKNKLREGIDDLKNFINEMEMALDGTIEH